MATSPTSRLADPDARGVPEALPPALLSVQHLRTLFPVRRGLWRRMQGYVHAVDDVSFDLQPGTTLGLVGESGCGKSTLGRSILRLIEPTSGQVRFDGQDVHTTRGAALKQLRRRMQLIFQDPFASLDPRLTVGRSVGEPLTVHRVGTRRERRQRVATLLERVGLHPADATRYPHEFSGGQRQRIGIARALALEPDFVVCDEPVSALDVSIQAQVLNLLRGLQRDLGLTYLFIAHDLAVVEHVSDRVAVMYLGKLVEIADVQEIVNSPRHPYTLMLQASVLPAEPGTTLAAQPPRGDPPSPIAPPPGCSFHPRCPYADERCRRELPPLETKPGLESNHFAACHYADKPLQLPPVRAG